MEMQNHKYIRNVTNTNVQFVFDGSGQPCILNFVMLVKTHCGEYRDIVITLLTHYSMIHTSSGTVTQGTWHVHILYMS